MGISNFIQEYLPPVVLAALVIAGSLVLLAMLARGGVAVGLWRGIVSQRLAMAFLVVVLLFVVAFATFLQHNMSVGKGNNEHNGIRKQVYDLTLEDLRVYPVWEFALDEEGLPGQDEETVRPFVYTSPLDPGDGIMVVPASFTLADGTEMSGYLTPTHQGKDIGYIRPTIITEAGQVGFWFGVGSLGPGKVSQYYSKLRKGPLQVFPLYFRSNVALIGGSVEGTIMGFLHYVDMHSYEVEIVK